jgi:hypothetical protein
MKKRVKAWGSEFVTRHYQMNFYHTKSAATAMYLNLNRDGRPDIIQYTITYEVAPTTPKNMKINFEIPDEVTVKTWHYVGLCLNTIILIIISVLNVIRLAH